MSEEERKSRIQEIRRELQRERELQRVKQQLKRLLELAHPRPEVTGW